MPRRLSVVVAQSQSHNPKKRAVEEEIVGQLLGTSGVDVTIVPHLYDLPADGSGMLCLTGITGDMVVCSWLYPRASRWILDRNGIHGREGMTLLKSLGESEDDEEDDEEDFDTGADEEDKRRVLDAREIPNRTIYCLDLRTHDTSAPYLEEIHRIANEQATDTVDLMQWIDGQPKPNQLDRYLRPEVGSGQRAVSSAEVENGRAPTDNNQQPTIDNPTIVDEDAPRRWYPVIDFSRCTNCLECIDFCLFGVYGIDQSETILVEQPDNCRKGCPACSRVCPENAIIFPQHKTPTIAGSPEVGGPLKIDLSKLFGAPDPGAPGAEKAVDVAVRERDEQLMLAGRETVGTSVGLEKRQSRDGENGPKDELDLLVDELDALDL